MLAALGRFCHRRPRWILLVWLVVVVAGFGLGSHVFDRLADTRYAPPGSESVRGDDLLTHAAGQGDQIVVLLDGHRVGDPRLRRAVEHAVGDVRTRPYVRRATDWYDTRSATLRARDGRASLVLVEVDGTADKPQRDRAYDQVTSRMRQLDGVVPGLRVEIGGATAVGRDVNGQLEHDLRTGELFALPVTFVLMILVFGGLVPALLPVASAVAAIATSLLSLLGFSYAVDVDSNAISITTILGLGLSIDYALLIVNRYREERGRGLAGPAAVERTVAVAGRTVCFSALTVATALSGLFAFRTPMFHTFAIAGVGIVVLAALAALTLVPALLAVAGRFVKVPTAPLPDDGFFARLARGTRRLAPLVVVGVVAVLLLAGAPFLHATFGGVGADILPASAQSRQVADAQSDRFPGGDADPVRVVASVPVSPLAAYGRETVRALPDVAHVRARAAGDGVSTLEVYATRASDGRSHDEVAEDIVRAIRAHRPGFPSYVTGSGALLVDMKAEIGDRLPWGVGLIAVTTFLLLFLMTGSVLVPMKALVMNALSLTATFGTLVLVFQEGHLARLLGFDPPGSLDLFVPILVFAFAFGLSMDYEVFLLSRIKEAYDATGDNTRAVELGLQRSGRIITSAALIVIIVCVGFTFGRLVFIKEMGLAMCVAVAVDATLVRCLLVPATMSLLGRANWWAPGWLRALHERLGLHEHADSHGRFAHRRVDGAVAPSADGD
ncbi:MAG: MMPL family transporter, partial [Acidothermales bacterium]|nr:MMPL family transporter [Acidothermales bacterium]